MYHIRDYLRKKYQIKVEPYWNVNITHFNPSILGISIKVEPYWNVNSLIANVNSLIANVNNIGDIN